MHLYPRVSKRGSAELKHHFLGRETRSGITERQDPCRHFCLCGEEAVEDAWNAATGIQFPCQREPKRTSLRILRRPSRTLTKESSAARIRIIAECIPPCSDSLEVGDAKRRIRLYPHGDPRLLEATLTSAPAFLNQVFRVVMSVFSFFPISSLPRGYGVTAGGSGEVSSSGHVTGRASQILCGS